MHFASNLLHVKSVFVVMCFVDLAITFQSDLF